MASKKEVKTEKLKKISTLRFTIIAIVLIAIFCVAITPIELQNDTFYTIKIGELITNNGIDMNDHFSWHQNLPYTYPHWLYDLCTYGIYSVFNFSGIYVMTCILSAILGISIFLVNSKLSKNNVISFFVTIGAMYLLKGYITARAQLVTFTLFIISIYLIETFLKDKKIIYGICLVLISLLIANLHCAVWPFFFVLFLPYIGEYIVALIAEIVLYNKIKTIFFDLRIKILSKKVGNNKKIEELQKKLKNITEKNEKIKIKRLEKTKNPYKIRMEKNNNVKWLILIMGICALMGFLTPIGDTPFTYLYKTMQGNSTKNINEHLPMTLANQAEIICTLVVFLAILIFTKVKIKLTDLFMIGGLTYLMFVSKRQETVFAIIGSVILSKMIVELIETYTKSGTISMKKFFNIPPIILLVTLLSLSLSWYFGKDRGKEKIINESSYPVKACDYIVENIDIKNARFFNDYNYGSYMLYRGIPVFIDSRCDLYTPEFNGRTDDIFMEFINTSGLGNFYEDTFKKYDITHLITFKNSKINMIIIKTQDVNYKELYSDDNFVVYQRLDITNK